MREIKIRSVALMNPQHLLTEAQKWLQVIIETKKLRQNWPCTQKFARNRENKQHDNEFEKRFEIYMKLTIRIKIYTDPSYTHAHIL